MISDTEMGIQWPQSWSNSRCNSPCRTQREDSKRILSIMDEKYRAIAENEKSLRKVVLIRNSLMNMQQIVREEKLAKQQSTKVNEELFTDLTPSITCVPPPTPPLSNLEIIKPIPRWNVDEEYCNPPPKRIKLSCDIKESKMDCDYYEPQGEKLVDYEFEMATPSSYDIKPIDEPYDYSYKSPSDEAQDIIRYLYDTCSTEGVKRRLSQTQSPYNDSLYSSNYCVSCVTSSEDNKFSNSDKKYSSCGRSSLLANDINSVVFHSLITSLES